MKFHELPDRLQDELLTWTWKEAPVSVRNYMNDALEQARDTDDFVRLLLQYMIELRDELEEFVSISASIKAGYMDGVYDDDHDPISPALTRSR